MNGEIALAKIFVVSHDENQFQTIAKNDSLAFVDLSKLDIPDRYLGNDLAENRFLLSDIGHGHSRLVGFVSARWKERFPKYPDLEELSDAISEKDFESCEVLAPQALALTNSEFLRWIKNQDAVHPGISAVLMDVIDYMNIDLEINVQRNIVMGNNFICSNDLFNDFLNFWRKGFAYIDSKYGFDIPFSYRCPRCGKVDEKGIWRWTRSRHPAFFYERLTAIFFASRPDVSLLKFKNKQLVNRKPSIQGKLMFGGPSIYKAANFPSRLLTECNHVYTSLGKN